MLIYNILKQFLVKLKSNGTYREEHDTVVNRVKNQKQKKLI